MGPRKHDRLPANHLARFIAEVVGELDLKPILETFWRKDSRGAEGYHPEMLRRLLLYGYAIGITISRRIERATYRYLAADDARLGKGKKEEELPEKLANAQ